MLWPAIAAFLATGGWYLILGWPIQLKVALKQKETVTEGIILGVLQNIKNLLSRPLMVGALTGLLIGDIKTGLEIGAAVQLMFLGVFVVGASIPPSPVMATVLGVVFASKAGASIGEALALVLPVSILSQMLMMGMLTWNSFFYQMGIRSAEDGDVKGVEFKNALLQSVSILINSVPAFLGVYFGTGLVQNIVSSMPPWLTGAFGKLGGVLPILGFALLLYSMNPGSLVVLFIAGFVLGSITNVPPLVMAALAACIAIFIEVIKGDGQEEFSEQPVIETTADSSRNLSLSDRVSLWWRNCTWFNVASWDVLGGWGFAYQMAPVLRRLYSTKEQLSAALSRHMTFWNTNMHAGAVIPGMVVAMEEEHAEDPERISADTIQGIKVATMGPLAGVGDSIFHATIAPIVLALGTAMVQEGNSFGVFFTSIVLFIIYSGTMWYLLDYGYRFGVNILGQLRAGGLVDKISEGAKIMGLIVAGAMVSKLANMAFAISYTAGAQVIDLQTILDGFMPKIPELALLFIVYGVLKKGVSAAWITLALMAFTILGTYFGFLA